MKARLGLVLGLAVIAATLVGFSSSPAQAATFGARLNRTPPIVGETVKVYGVVPPATRPVALQTWRSGRWVTLASARTAARGAYGFNVKALAAAASYRVYARKARIKGKTAAARYSNAVRVAGVRPSVSLGFVPAPVGISTSANVPAEKLLTPGVVTFRPARPGSAVYVQRLVGGQWSTVLGGTGRQDAAGTFKFKGVVAGSAADPYTFRALSSVGSGVGRVFSGTVVPAYWTKKFDDDFSDPTISNQQWKSRPSAPDTNRACMYPYQDMFSVAGGTATLKVQKVGTVSPKGVSCPQGFWKTAVVGTLAGSPSFSQKYGLFAARIKFHPYNGAHGAFWIQGVGSSSAEIDTEYFGDGRADGGLTNFVHVVASRSPLKIVSSGGMQPGYKSILGAGNTPSNGWHVYSVQWSPSGYIFRIDGVPTFSTNKPRVAAVEEEMLLSLVTSDYEVPYLNKAGRTSLSMQVDWVRTWQ